MPDVGLSRLSPHLPLALPDRLVQGAMTVSAAAVHAAAISLVGLPARWIAVGAVVSGAAWCWEARRAEHRTWVGAVALAGFFTAGLVGWGAIPAVAMIGAGGATFVAWALVGGLRRLTLVEGALDRAERLALRSAMCLGLAGALAIAAPSFIATALGVLAWALAATALGWTLVRDRRRASVLRELYAGDVAGLRIVDDAEARGLEALPPLLSGTLTDAVIVARDAGAATYREGTGQRPVARCQRDRRDALGVLEKRASTLVATFGALLGASPIALGAHLHFARPPALPPAHAAEAALTAPTCVAARGYFHESLPTAVRGVGRAVLLTHDQDPTIAEGSGLLLLVPEGGGSSSLEMRAQALSWANHVPCRDKLLLDVDEAMYHPVQLVITIGLDGLVPSADVEREVRDTVTEMFERDGRSVRAEHVDFGSEQKSVGYAVRYALRHVPGVKSAKVEVNGREVEEPLGPREFPVLEGYTVRIP